MKTHLTQRYGAKKFDGLTIQDWGVTWDDIEHCYDKFEYLCGVSGKAGVIKGQVQPGGNPFEGSRSREYPNPPLTMPYSSTLFMKAANGYGAASLSRRPPPTCRGLMSIRWASRWANAPIAAIASVSAAPIIPNPRPDHAFCRC